MDARKPLPLLALNHVSRVCRDLEASYLFYSEVLGFLPVKRPTSFNFDGAWLFNYGIGLHLIKGCPPERPSEIIPKSCHISFQAANLDEVECSLVRLGCPYKKNVFVEDGIQVAQLFFHDPDNNMIEVCNCDLLPVVPLQPDSLCACPVTAGVAATTAPRPPSELLSLVDADITSASIDTVSSSEMEHVTHDGAASSQDVTVVSMAEALGTAGMERPPETEAGARSMSMGGSDSFSDSGMSGLTTGNDGYPMGLALAELDEWPSVSSGPSGDGMPARASPAAEKGGAQLHPLPPQLA